VPSLSSNLVGRVNRLPKPARAPETLIPIFEAISNAIHAVAARLKDKTASHGRIEVVFEMPKSRKPLTVTIKDNGIGLNATHFDAFLTTDTENKVEIGGKGVGRVMWLDAFERVHVLSTYLEDRSLKVREFDFVLSNSDQIQNYKVRRAGASATPGTVVTLTRLRDNNYKSTFPKRKGYISQYLFSHFLPIFVSGACPQLNVDIGDEEWSYPGDIGDFIFRTQDVKPAAVKPFGSMRLILMECDKKASSDLKGSHFVHFVGDNRTVRSQNIDAKLGLKTFGSNNDRTFHACLFGNYLDQHVNQERTAFTFDDRQIDEIINSVCMPEIEKFLAGPLSELRTEQQGKIASIIESYPSVSFGKIPTLQKHLPKGELVPDAIYGHLARERFRRDERQAKSIREVLTKLRSPALSYEELANSVRSAVVEMEAQEKRSLAEYVLRRKVVLDFMEELLKRCGLSDTGKDYEQENILHAMICPLRISTVDGQPNISPASHDLWVVDERLAFAQYFHSDKTFRALGAAHESDDRADVIVFNTAHGLTQSDDAARVLIVEFKRPGRKNYPASENPIDQVTDYVRKLQKGGSVDLDGRPIALGAETVFYCFIVADIVGNLEKWTSTWEKTVDGRGRRYVPRSGFQGSIEVIGWDTVLKDAKSRNKAFFERAGLSGQSIFTPKSSA
jgi:hypothetical protein